MEVCADAVMPWEETSPMNERVRFVAAMLEGEESFTELCERFGISRKQGYKWKSRYEAGGVTALKDLSRSPHNHPRRIESEVVELLLSARRRHPTWGPRKLLVVLRRHHPNIELPVASTVGEILKRNGLVGPRKRVRRSEPYGSRLREKDSKDSTVHYAPRLSLLLQVQKLAGRARNALTAEWSAQTWMWWSGCAWLPSTPARRAPRSACFPSASVSSLADILRRPSRRSARGVTRRDRRSADFKITSPGRSSSTTVRTSTACTAETAPLTPHPDSAATPRASSCVAGSRSPLPP
jgi:transposase